MSSDKRGSGSDLTVANLVVTNSLDAPGVSIVLGTVQQVYASSGVTATTASTSAVMAGTGGTFVPRANGSGKVKILVTGVAGTQTGASIVSVSARYGTGTPPVNGAAAAGSSTPTGERQVRASAAAVTPAFPFSIGETVTGLTPGATYWLDLSYKTAAAGSPAILGNLSIMVEDCQ